MNKRIELHGIVISWMRTIRSRTVNAVAIQGNQVGMSAIKVVFESSIILPI